MTIERAEDDLIKNIETMPAPAVPRFKSFEAMVLFFNGMYKLPIAPFPSLEAEAQWQSLKFPMSQNAQTNPVDKRLEDFFGTILKNEVKEHEDIRAKLAFGETVDEVDVLVDLADLLGDIIVYCASEMIRYGIPVNDTLRIIMESNFSKLGADGQPIYDATGKVSKGPGYWKPEPMIRLMLEQLRADKLRSYGSDADDAS